MADASLVVRIGSDVSGIEQGVRVVNRQLGDLTNKVGAASSACDTLRKAMHAVTGITIAGAALQGLSMLKSAMESLGKTALDYNKTLETSRLGIAGILHSMSAITDASGRQLQGQQKFNAAVQVAMQQQKQLEVIAMSTAVTYQEVVTVYQALLAPAMAAKLTMGQTVTLTGLMANSVKAMNLPMNQIVQESRDMLTGNIDNNSQLAKSLGITREMIKEWTKKQTLFDEISKRLEGFTYASREFENTWDGAVSNLKDAFQKALGTGMGPLMQPLIDGVKTLAGAFLDVERNVDGTVKKITVKQSIIEGIYNFVANPLYKAWMAVQGAAETINELFIKQSGVLRLVTDAVLILLGWVLKIVDGWGWIVSAVLPAVAAGLGKVNELFNYLIKGASDFGFMLLNAMYAVGESLGTIMKAAWQGITGDFKGAGETLGNIFKGKAVENMKGWSAELQKTGTGFKAAVGGMGAIMDQFLDKTVAWQQGLKKSGSDALGKFGVTGNQTPDTSDAKAAAKALKLAEQYEKDYLSDMEKWRKAQEQLADTYDKAAIAAAEQRRDRELAILKNQYDQGLLSQADYLDKQYQQQVAASDKALDQLEAAALRNDQAYYAALKAEPAKPTDGNPVAVEAYNKAILLTVKLLQESEAAWAKVDAAAAKSATAAIVNEGAKAAIQRDNAKAALGFEAQLLQMAGETYAATLKQIEADKIGRKPIDAKTDALRDQLDAVKALKAAQDETNRINAIKDSTTDINISMMNDPYAEQRAAVEERYRREAELIQQNIDLKIAAGTLEMQEYEALSAKLLAMAQKRDKAISDSQRNQGTDGWNEAVKAAQRAFPKLVGIDKALYAVRQDYTVKNIDGTRNETKSNLSMYAGYAEGAAALMGGIASTMDTTSRSGFETAKALNIGMAVMSTAAGVMNAFRDVPYPANIAVAATTAALGAAQIAMIAATSFGGAAQAPQAPAMGTFTGGSALTGGTVGASIGNQYTSVGESQDQESLQRIAASMENASLALGRVADGLTKVGDLFGDDTFMSKAIESIAYASTTYSYASTTDRSIMHTAQLDMTAGDVSTRVMEYFESKRKAGWYNYATTWTVGGGIEELFQQSLDRVASQIMRGAAVMSTTANLSAADIDQREIKLVGRKPDDIAADLEKWFADASGAMAITVDGLIDFTFYGENAFDALMRLSTALQSANEAFELIGATLIDDTMAGGNAAYKLQQLMGGTEAFTESIDSYFTTMFSDAEQDAARAAQANRQVNTAFAEINTVMAASIPKTREEFRNLVNSLDVTTDAGASTFAALMNVSEAFGIVMDAADEAAAKPREIQQATEDLNVRYLKATGQSDAAAALDRQLSDQREIEAAIADGMGDAYIARLKEVLALEEQAVTNSAALDVINNNLETANSALSVAAGDFKTAIDTATKSLQDNANATKQALSDATGALDSSYAAQRAIIIQQQQEVLESLTDGLDKAQAAADELQNTFNMLQSARQGMQLDGNSVSAWREASADLASILAAARNGDTSRIAGIGRTLDVVSNISTDGFTDQSDYQRAYWQTSNSIMELENLTGKQLTDAQQQVIALQNIIDLTKTGNDAVLQAFDDELSALKGISKNTLPIAEARANYLAAKQADDIAQAELKKQTDWMTSQYNALTAINSSVLSVSDAIYRYMSAKDAVTKAQAAADAVTKAQAAADAAKVASAATAINNSAVAGVSGGVDTVVVPGVVDTPASTASDLDSLIRAYVNDTVAVLGATDNAWMRIYNVAVANGISSSQLASAAGTNVADILAWTDMMRLPRFALGGITTGPSIAGEAGYPEAVVPLPDGRRIPVRMEGSADNRELINEVRQLRAEVSALRSGVGQVSAATQKTAKALDRWDNDGMPEVRT